MDSVQRPETTADVARDVLKLITGMGRRKPLPWWRERIAHALGYTIEFSTKGRWLSVTTPQFSTGATYRVQPPSAWIRPYWAGLSWADAYVRVAQVVDEGDSETLAAIEAAEREAQAEGSFLGWATHDWAHLLQPLNKDIK